MWKTLLLAALLVPLMYVALLYQHRDILRDQLKLDLEKEYNYPRIGHLVFLVGAYKPVVMKMFHHK